MGCGASNPEYDRYPGEREEPERGGDYTDNTGAEAFFGHSRQPKNKNIDPLPKSEHLSGLKASRGSEAHQPEGPSSTTTSKGGISGKRSKGNVDGTVGNGHMPGRTKPKPKTDQATDFHNKNLPAGKAESRSGGATPTSSSREFPGGDSSSSQPTSAEAVWKAANAAHTTSTFSSATATSHNTYAGGANNSEVRQPHALPHAPPTEDSEEDPREQTRRRVLEDLKMRMMGLEKDPRIVLQVLGIKLPAHPPTNEQLMAGYKKAMVQFHPDRQRQKALQEGSTETDGMYDELLAEETFKLITFHRDALKAVLEAKL